MRNSDLLAVLVTASALLAIATCDMARATPWTVPDGEGGWEPNPECQSSKCQDTGTPDPKPEQPKPEKPQYPSGGGEGREPVAYPGVMAFRTCCEHDGQRYATARLFRSREAAARDCAKVIAPPACFPLSDPNPKTGSLK